MILFYVLNFLELIIQVEQAEFETNLVIERSFFVLWGFIPKSLIYHLSAERKNRSQYHWLKSVGSSYLEMLRYQGLNNQLSEEP